MDNILNITNQDVELNGNERPIIVGLDIGTTKIVAIAGRKNEYGKLDILGFGRANSNGVEHGMVLNIDLTIKAIQTALENCLASFPTNLQKFALHQRSICRYCRPSH